jgi:hypothetical protein
MVLKKYTDAGVNENKLILSKQPSVCKWSLTRKCLVGENGVASGDVVNSVLTYENTRIVSMQNRTTIDVFEINNSNGIIVSEAIYDKPYFRFGFIPTT